MDFRKIFNDNPKNIYLAAAAVGFVVINIIGLVLYQAKTNKKDMVKIEAENITDVPAVNTPTEGPTPTDFPADTPEPPSPTRLPTKAPTATTTPSPTSTPTPGPTSTPAPTNTPAPTVTVVPTTTPVPPTATPTSVGTT